MQLLDTQGGASVLLEAGAVFPQFHAGLFHYCAREAQGGEGLDQLPQAFIGSVQRRLANLGEVLQRREGVRRHEALLVGAVDIPGKTVHKAQQAVLLAVGGHLQQGLGFQFVDDAVELLLLRLHGLAQSTPAFNSALQGGEIFVKALQQLQLLGQHLA
ncbi:hypothetical protein D3C79_721730 [compost metagenome]